MLPLTDLDIEMLALAWDDGSPPTLPALVPSPEVARATYDKYETHLLLERLGLPSPPTVLPDRDEASMRSTIRSWSSPAAAPARARSTLPTIPNRRASSSTTCPSR